MLLKSLLQLLYQVSQARGTSPPLLVGGVVRDRLIGNIKNSFNDLDITTGDNTIAILAKEFSIKLKKYLPIYTKQALDGHFSIYLPDLKIDFSSNFNVPGIEEILKNKGIQNPTSLQKEAYSRDFTINALLMSLDFRKIKDITGEGIKDIKNKKIRTCLTPDLTFKYNTNRIIRVVYLAAKLDFDVDPIIIEWIKNNPQYLSECETSYLSKNIDKALEYNPKKTVSLLNEMNLWKYIPITRKLYPYFSKHSVEESINVTK